MDLLAKVLSAGEKEVGEEKVQEAADNINKELKESAKAQKRKASSIDTLTGAEGVSYMEYAKDKDESAKYDASNVFLFFCVLSYPLYCSTSCFFHAGKLNRCGSNWQRNSKMLHELCGLAMLCLRAMSM